MEAGALGVGDGHHPVRPTGHLDRHPHRVTLADRVERRVHPAGRGLPHPLGQPLAVRHRDRPETPQVLVVELARRPDDRGSPSPGELHRQGAHSPGRAVDQHRLALAEPQEIHHAPGGLGRDGQGRRLLPRQRDRLDHQLVGPGQGLLGVGPGGRATEHGVARLHADDVLAHRLDDARRLDAGNVRQFDGDVVGHGPAADLVIERIDAGAPHGDPDLPGAGDGQVGVDEAQDVGGAVGVEGDCLDGGHGITMIESRAIPRQACRFRVGFPPRSARRAG